jgi:hypothetical protein
MCEEWKRDFMSFYNWALSAGYKSGLQIDRINVDGNYEPDNCRFVTAKENSRNKRNAIKVEIDGETKYLPEWCEDLGINYNTVFSRIMRGLSPKEALLK